MSGPSFDLVPYRGPEDLPDLTALLNAAWRDRGPRVPFHLGDLLWRLRDQPGRDPNTDLLLARQGPDLAGFAWFDPPDSGDLLLHPQAPRAALTVRLLAWLEGRARDAGSLTVGAFESDADLRAQLTARGYAPGRDGLRHRVLDLASLDQGPAPEPAGYSIRGATDADTASLAACVAAAFGSRPKPAEAYRDLRALPGYRPELERVAIGPAGEVVAFTLAWLDPSTSVGLLEPVGCHPEHRRKGLGLAVVRDALATLKTAGAAEVVVYPGRLDDAAQRFYQACGFEVLEDDEDWVLTLQG